MSNHWKSNVTVQDVLKVFALDHKLMNALYLPVTIVMNFQILAYECMLVFHCTL